MLLANNHRIVDLTDAKYSYDIRNGVFVMSIKSIVLAAGATLVIVSSAGAAFADPYIQKENKEQYAVSAQESLVPTSRQAMAAEEQKLKSPSAFGTPGPYYASEKPFEVGNPHWGPAEDADQN